MKVLFSFLLFLVTGILLSVRAQSVEQDLIPPFTRIKLKISKSKTDYKDDIRVLLHDVDDKNLSYYSIKEVKDSLTNFTKSEAKRRKIILHELDKSINNIKEKQKQVIMNSLESLKKQLKLEEEKYDTIKSQSRDNINRIHAVDFFVFSKVDSIKPSEADQDLENGLKIACNEAVLNKANGTYVSAITKIENAITLYDSISTISRGNLEFTTIKADYSRRAKRGKQLMKVRVKNLLSTNDIAMVNDQIEFEKVAHEQSRRKIFVFDNFDTLKEIIDENDSSNTLVPEDTLWVSRHLNSETSTREDNNLNRDSCIHERMLGEKKLLEQWKKIENAKYMINSWHDSTTKLVKALKIYSLDDREVFSDADVDLIRQHIKDTLGILERKKYEMGFKPFNLLTKEPIKADDDASDVDFISEKLKNALKNIQKDQMDSEQSTEVKDLVTQSSNLKISHAETNPEVAFVYIYETTFENDKPIRNVMILLQQSMNIPSNGDSYLDTTSETKRLNKLRAR